MCAANFQAASAQSREFCYPWDNTHHFGVSASQRPSDNFSQPWSYAFPAANALTGYGKEQAKLWAVELMQPSSLLICAAWLFPLTPSKVWTQILAVPRCWGSHNIAFLSIIWCLIKPELTEQPASQLGAHISCIYTNKLNNTRECSQALELDQLCC